MGTFYNKEAESLFKRSIEIFPANFDAYYNLSAHARRMGDTLKSKSYLYKCLEYAPNYKNALYDLASIYVNTNKSDSALFFLDKIVPEGADYQVVCELYFIIYYNKSDFNKALVYAEKGIKMDPENPGSYLDKAGALMSLGDTVGSLEYVERYKKLEKH